MTKDPADDELAQMQSALDRVDADITAAKRQVAHDKHMNLGEQLLGSDPSGGSDDETASDEEVRPDEDAPPIAPPG